MGEKTASPGRIGAKEKASFALVNLGNIPIMSLINGYLLIFYTDVVGLDPAAVATLFLLVRVLDGLNDPIMGFVIDHLPRTKMGRFRGYLLIGCIVCSINYVLLWFGPQWAPVGKLVVAYITYILIGITFDLMDIPLNSLIPAMTDVEKERSSLSTIKGLFYMLGTALFSIGAPLVLSRAGTPITAYYILVFAAVGIVLVFSILGTLGVRERIEPVEGDEKYRLRDVFSIITIGPVVATFLATLMFSVNSGLTSSSNVFFATYVLGGRIEILSLTTIMTLIGVLPAVALSGVFVGRFGKKPVFVVALLLCGLAPLLRLFDITFVPLWLAACVVAGLGTGTLLTLSYGLQADNVDYVEYTRGHRAEGCIASLSSFVVKAGGGIGSALSGYVLAASGYVPNAAQTDTAKLGILLCNIVIPAGFMLLASLVFSLGYRVSRQKMAEVTEALRQRRAEKRTAAQPDG